MCWAINGKQSWVLLDLTKDSQLPELGSQPLIVSLIKPATSQFLSFEERHRTKHLFI